MAKAKILIVDDEKPTRDVMVKILSRRYTCLAAPDPEQALALLGENRDTALVLTDYKMPGMNGIDLIKAAKKGNPSLGAILITAFGEIELAVKAMKEGADDFLTKPITDIGELEDRVSRAIAVSSLDRATVPAVARPSRLSAFTGTSPEMERVYALIRRIAPTAATVLVQGPSGTGKELVARALHDLSPRKDAPFIAVECSAFSEDLLKSELFGYVAGTFTGQVKEGKVGCIEAADGGTLFLDEIGEIDKSTQVALLRTLESRRVRRLGSAEEKPVDFRLIAATNRDLKAMVASGDFREDLFYRLNVIDIRLPALKDRPGDTELLAGRFLGEFASRYSSPARSFSPDALAALAAYPWPGNVRELRNIVERMTVLATGEVLTAADVPPEILQPAVPSVQTRTDSTPAAAGHGQTLAETEKAQILAALEAAGGNKSKAAEALGISRRTLHRKLNEWKSQD